MAKRPRIKSVRQNKFPRCPKCGKQTRVHTKRCKTCHLPLKVG